MKKTKQILFLSILLIFSTYSYAQSILDSSNDTIAIIDNNLILNMEGDAIGEFLTNGEVKDKLTQNTIGYIEENYFRNTENILIGYLDEQNNVKDINGNHIGKIHNQTIVYDLNDMVIGKSSSGIASTKLAAYFFFFFSKDM